MLGAREAEADGAGFLQLHGGLGSLGPVSFPRFPHWCAEKRRTRRESCLLPGTQPGSPSGTSQPHALLTLLWGQRAGGSRDLGTEGQAVVPNG